MTDDGYDGYQGIHCYSLHFFVQVFEKNEDGFYQSKEYEKHTAAEIREAIRMRLAWPDEEFMASVEYLSSSFDPPFS